MTSLLRFRPVTVLALALATMLFTPTAQAQVVLKPKLRPDTKRAYQAESNTKQILTLLGMDIETKVTQFVTMEQVIGPRAADGTLRLTDTNKKLQQEFLLPGGVKVSFDSDNPNKKAPVAQLEPILELLRVIAKAKVTLVFDKSDKVVKVEGINDVLKDLDPDLRKSLSSQFSNKVILARWKDRIKRIPVKAVRVGEKWEHTTVMNLEAGQKISVKRQYTYAGTTKRGQDTVHRITTKSLAATLTQDPPEGSPTTITASKLKIAKGTGEILIDLEQGVVLSESDSTRMTGTLTIVVNGMSLDGTLDLTIANKLQLQK